MQINSVNNVNPNFGMAMKATPEALDRIASKISKVDDWSDLNRWINREKHNDVVDILLSVKNNKLSANVGPRKFEEGRMGGIMKPIRDAAYAADEIKGRFENVKLEADKNYISTICEKIDLIDDASAKAGLDLNA